MRRVEGVSNPVGITLSEAEPHRAIVGTAAGNDDRHKTANVDGDQKQR